MSVEKRMMLAVAVSFVVIVLWSTLFMPKPQPGTDDVNPAAEQQLLPDSGATGTEDNLADGTADATADEDSATSDDAVVENIDTEADPTESLMITEEVVSVIVETSRYKATVTNANGGSISSFLVKMPGEDGVYYEETTSDDPLDLVASEELARSPFALMGTAIRDASYKYEALPALPVLHDYADGQTVEMDGGVAVVRFEYHDPQVGRLAKTFIFREDTYIFDVNIAAEKFSGSGGNSKRFVHTFGPGVGELVRQMADGTFQPIMEGNGYLLRRKGEGIEKNMRMIRERGGLGAEEQDLKVEPMRDALLEWAGLYNNYFMTLAFKTDVTDPTYFTPAARLISVQSLGSGEQQEFYEIPYLDFETFPAETSFSVYAGPKQIETLESEAGGKLKEVVSFGWFSFISRPAFWLLKQIYGVVSNYGVAIIILTLIINLIILPLIISQRKSMVSMQRLQPQMKSLQAKYKADRGDDIKTRQEKKKQLNEEMMALYKQEKVNPMGGCLPLLIQMPILFALFDMFRAAIELRKAPFVLWWQDLSAADPTFVLPILMGVAMFLQQRMTPTPADSQSGALKMLPFLFVFLLASAPSGLVLYWTTSSLFNIGTQLVMNNTMADVKKQHAQIRQQNAAKKSAKKGRRKK